MEHCPVPSNIQFPEGAELWLCIPFAFAFEKKVEYEIDVAIHKLWIVHFVASF